MKPAGVRWEIKANFLINRERLRGFCFVWVLVQHFLASFLPHGRPHKNYYTPVVCYLLPAFFQAPGAGCVAVAEAGAVGAASCGGLVFWLYGLGLGVRGGRPAMMSSS